jgi:pimeloyl-ACP methyl ester carboxylesterase
MGERARWLGGLLVAALLAGLAGCATADAATVIQIDRPTTLADDPVGIIVRHVEPGERVELSAETVDYRSTRWRSVAVFVADAEGVVDLGAAAPVEGYVGVDSMGLFWSMDPVNGTADDIFSPMFPELSPQFDVVIRASPERSGAATVSIRRVLMSPTVSVRELTADRDGVAGFLYAPQEARGSVLLVGGSEGGVSLKFHAALLASHGYAALALGYFALPGLPTMLRDIPIEYFAAAIDRLPSPPRVIGYSRGTEATLLLAALYPDRLHDAIIVSPASQIWPAFPGPGNAWTHAGRPQTSIPFDKISVPVRAFAGSDDQLWPSAAAAVRLQQVMKLDAVVFPGVGHGIGLPYFPAASSVRHPVTGSLITLGGTRAANDQAARRAWAAIIATFA